MKCVFKQVVAVLVAVKALFAAMGEALKFQAAQNRGVVRPAGGPQHSSGRPGRY